MSIDSDSYIAEVLQQEQYETQDDLSSSISGKASPVLLIPGVSGSILKYRHKHSNASFGLYPIVLFSRSKLSKYLFGWLNPDTFVYESDDPVCSYKPYHIVAFQGYRSFCR